jgi:hypothetical protein
MFDSYLQYRDEGCAPKAAAELTARLYGKTTAEEVRRLQVTLEALEQRDRPPGTETTVAIPAGVGSLYLSERRAGRSHARAREAVKHAYAYDGVDLDRQLVRPQARFESELLAWTPSAGSDSLIKEAS